MQCWIVGVCLPGGHHEYRCFDHYEGAARKYAATIDTTKCRVFVWDLFQGKPK